MKAFSSPVVSVTVLGKGPNPRKETTIMIKNSLLLVTALAVLGGATARAAEPEWVTRSNTYAQEVLKVTGDFFPESIAQLGVEGIDENILDLKPDVNERLIAATKAAVGQLQKALKSETDPRVRQDLQILIKAGQRNIRSVKLDQKYLVPYYNVGQTIFFSIQGLLDPQVAKKRQTAVIVRLRRYAGMEPGYQPLVELAKARTLERMKNKNLIGPFRGEVEQDLKRLPTFINGARHLLASSGLDGWQKPYGRLEKQLDGYTAWVRKTVLPRSRKDARLPRELYEDALRNWGVEEKPENLIRLGTAAFVSIRDEMMTLAPLVAKEKGFTVTDYRGVLRALKKDTLTGDNILGFYKKRLSDIEGIIRAHKLVTIPKRKIAITMKTAAESAAQPAASVKIPRLIGNTGEYPEFQVPLLVKNPDGTWQTNDSAVKAETWTLTAHEAMPGHALQFVVMLQEGVSIARAVFAFNSANVEGWALYAESMIKPYMPLDGQLVSLQDRLLRAARIFLDPMLNLGQISAAEAKRLLMEDVVIGDSDAQNEVERYTYRIPGQATAYYYGFNRLRSLRAETELKLRDKFDRQAFHDFILHQGLLPPDLLRKAVLERFVPAQLGTK